MSALPRPPLAQARVLAPMTVPALEAVLKVEIEAYAFPWSRANFIDSLHAGYLAWMLMDAASRQLLGYYIAMPGVEEMHLLNITVAPTQQGRGHALFMLDALCEQSRRVQAQQVWLEVRTSNARAHSIYERYGFRAVGVRRGYYPAAGGLREDALVMSLPL